MNEEPLMTIVIPAYNEAHRLPETLRRTAAFIKSRPEPLDILVVNNNSRDATSEIVQDFARSHPCCAMVNQPIQGKGAAVRKGMLEGRGRYLFIADADLAMPIEELPRFFPQTLGGDYDLAIGSREAPGAHRYNEPWYRHLMGRVFNPFVRLMAVPDIQDTQCGFKSFRREIAHDLFQTQKIDGFAFDVEVLAIARHRGYKILEVGIPWYYGPGSSINPIRDTLRMIREVLHIRRNLKSGLYNRRPPIA